MRVENYFLRYALPCVYSRREKPSDLDIEILEGCIREDAPVNRLKLEELFSGAIERIRRFSGIQDIWDEQVIEDYFKRQHNLDVINGDGSYVRATRLQKNISCVYLAEVLEKNGLWLKVKYKSFDGKDEERQVNGEFINADVSDKVYIHFFHAVELER